MELLDYGTLRVIWWLLLGVLLIAFALTDGWDLGIAALLPFVARSDVERRLVINVVGPTWEGNQVWLILGAGAIFAAWPFVYAVSFSGFYLAMFLLLAALILRPVGFKYRSKRASTGWRAGWDWALFVGGLVPALVFGVAVGNVLLGAPFHLDSDLRVTYDGGLLGLFSPFSLLCGLLSVAMVVLHGAAYLSIRIEHGPVHARARRFGSAAALVGIVLFAVGGLYVAYGGLGFAVTSAIDPAGPSNPVRTVTVPQAGAWLANYARYPWTMIAPVLGFVGLVAAWLGVRAGREGPALTGSSLATLGIISTVGLSMFPIILPSTVNERSSLLVWNASSSHSTLFLMLIMTVIFLPLILIYTAWVYRVLWGRITTKAVQTNPDFY